MKRALYVGIVMGICGALVVHGGSDRRIGEHPNRDSLVQQINSVTVLNFQTDRPISEMRLSIDGKEMEATNVRTTERGLWLAVVPQNERLDLQIKAGDQNLLMTAKWPILVDDLTREGEDFGPGKQIKMDGWIVVYGIERTTSQGEARGSLKLEIR